MLEHGGFGVQRHLNVGAELVRFFDVLFVLRSFLVPNDRPARLEIEQIHVPLGGEAIDLEQRRAGGVRCAAVHPDGMLDAQRGPRRPGDLARRRKGNQRARRRRQVCSLAGLKEPLGLLGVPLAVEQRGGDGQLEPHNLV